MDDFTSLKLISTCLHKGCLALIPGFIPICYAESFICASDGYNRSGIRFFGSHVESHSPWASCCVDFARRWMWVNGFYISTIGMRRFPVQYSCAAQVMNVKHFRMR